MNNQYLLNKNILFISPSFFGYENDIIKELNKSGAKVIYIKEIENISRWKYFLRRYIRKQWKKSLLKTIKLNQFDFLFVIKGSSFDDEVINIFSYLDCKKILYQYDSILRYPNILKLIPHFNETFTFEYDDYERYKNLGLKFRPLFFCNNFKKEILDFNKYKISSVCSFYPERMAIMNKLINIIGNKGLYLYIYISKTLLIKKLLNNSIINFKYLKTKKLKREKLIKIMSMSDCILDIKNKEQKGLTMRTFETIGMGKKLITNNDSISKYNFYNPNNIFILKEDNVLDINNFLSVEMIKIPQNIIKIYNINHWCKDIFLNKDKNTKYLNS